MFLTLALTLGLGVSSVAASRALSGRWITACTGYWMAWIFVLLSALYAEHHALIPETSEFSLVLITKAHTGAFVGFLAGSWLPLPLDLRSVRRRPYGDIATWEQLINRYLKWFALAFFSLGVVHLVERLVLLGHVGAAPLVYGELRLDFLDRDLTWLGRFLEYLSPAIFMVAIVLGMTDAVIRVRISRVIFLTAAAVPHGLAMGGRGFLLGVLVPYVASFLLQNSQERGGRIYKHFVVSVGSFVLVAFIAFSILGKLRAVGMGEETFSVLSPVDMVSMWFGTSVPAIEPFAALGKVYRSGMVGASVFYWPVKQLQRLGVLDGDIDSRTWDVIWAVRAAYGMVGNAPPTAIPALVWDFGETLLPVAMGVLMALCQIASLRLSGRGFISHTIATLAFIAACTTIQIASFLTPSNCLLMLWVLPLSWWFKRRLHGARSRSPVLYRPHGAHWFI